MRRLVLLQAGLSHARESFRHCLSPRHALFESHEYWLALGVLRLGYNDRPRSTGYTPSGASVQPAATRRMSEVGRGGSWRENGRWKFNNAIETGRCAVHGR